MVLLENRPDALAIASSIVAKNNVMTMSGFHNFDSKNNWVEWSFFADFTKASATPEQVSVQLSNEAVVKRTEFRESILQNIAIDDIHFPIVTGEDERVLFLKETTIVAAIDKIWDIFGPGAATILWEMGRAAGEQEAKTARERLRLNQRDAISYLVADKKANGWCVSEVTELSMAPLKMIVRAVHSPECEHRNPKRKETRSFFLKGYLDAYLGTVFEKTLKIKESKCEAKGDNMCEFELTE